MIDPEFQRLGGHTIVFLPFIFLFCAARIIQSFSIITFILMASCLLMLVISLSRTPLLISVVGFFLILSTTPKRSRLKIFALIFSIFFTIALTIISFQPLKLLAARSFSRITYQDVTVGDQVIDAEMPDIIRWTIHKDSLSLYKSNWIFGIGYMNFMPWFGDEYNYSKINTRGKEVVGMNLHNTFMTWALEGGIPCVAIIFLILWKYFRILNKRIKQSEDIYERSYYKLLAISMICIFIRGLFHQIHQDPLFYIFIGIVYALDDRYRLSGAPSYSI
jgi:hypothetical protein